MLKAPHASPPHASTGAMDLTQYIVHRCSTNNGGPDSNPRTSLRGKRVLELGCGHGLPGLAAGLAGADLVVFQVSFAVEAGMYSGSKATWTTPPAGYERAPLVPVPCAQDYNREVLTALTIPSVTANVQRVTALQHRPATRFLAGPWALLPAWLESAGLRHSFDVVLTAETIYNTDSSVQLYDCLVQVSACRRQPGNVSMHALQCCSVSTQALKPDGIALVAAKTYYFGLGGGSLAFKRLMQQQQTNQMTAQTVAEVKDGASNLREIFEVSFVATSAAR